MLQGRSLHFGLQKKGEKRGKFFLLSNPFVVSSLRQSFNLKVGILIINALSISLALLNSFSRISNRLCFFPSSFVDSFFFFFYFFFPQHYYDYNLENWHGVDRYHFNAITSDQGEVIMAIE
jgi:hypothetical protein